MACGIIIFLNRKNCRGGPDSKILLKRKHVYKSKGEGMYKRA
jgi:hypothetical protein